jgi:hypothetical protein
MPESVLMSSKRASWLLWMCLAACSSAAPNAAPYYVAGSTAPAAPTAGSAAAGAPAMVAGSSAAGSAAAGSAAAGNAAPAGPGTFTGVLAIFADAATHNCGICHASAAAPSNGGLQFNPSNKAAAFAAFVGPVSAGSPGSMCGGKTYVVPGSPTTSLLYDKLANMPPACGARMPMGFMPLNATELETVRSWIAAGATNN